MNQLIEILLYIYPLLCVFLPSIIYQVILYKKQKGEYRINKINLIWRYILLLYLYLVMKVVGMGSIWEFGKYGSLIRLDEINLIPFQSDGYMTYILNVIMLMPLGFLLPLIWGNYRKITKTVVAGFLLSLSIELGQLFNRRVTDIDDLMMNSLGAAVGFGIWFIFNKLFKTTPRDKRIFADKPLVYIFLAVLGTFLLFNWRWLIRHYVV